MSSKALLAKIRTAHGQTAAKDFRPPRDEQSIAPAD
jgi:hypothetical protein